MPAVKKPIREHARGTTAGARPASLIDPKSLMRIKSLALRAKVVVEGLYSGLHRSPYHGFSVEFTEYRQYTPGDDPRYLDWRLFARSDRYYIKRFEDETNLRCYLLVDHSQSMGYGSGEYTKTEYATTLAATLAYFLSTQRDAVGLITFDEGISQYVPARYRPGHLQRLMLCLEQPLAGHATDLNVPLREIARTVRKRGMIVLVSDLLAPVDELERYLGYLRSQRHDIVLLRVLDPAERGFQFDGPAMFHDLESDRELYIEPAAARATYLKRFREHQAGIERTCARLGVDYFDVPTDKPLELVLFDFLRSRTACGQRPARRGA
jgi:uncharacterized protein (DUF58 family)